MMNFLICMAIGIIVAILIVIPMCFINAITSIDPLYQMCIGGFWGTLGYNIGFYIGIKVCDKFNIY